MNRITGLKKLFLPLALLLLVLASGCQPAATPVDTPPAAPVTQAAVEYWQTQFPAQVASYLRTKEEEATAFAGSVPYQKLDAYPFMRTMYHGFGFWFDFRESRGHMYTIEDTLITGRPKFGGVCLACKSADYPALVAEYGQVEFDTMPWSEAAKKTAHPVACIDCHDPDSPDFALRLTRPWLEEAIVAQGKTLADFDMRSLVCAQCHAEYYFEGPFTQNKVVFPWSQGFRPEDALAHFNAENFSDWTHPRTGAGVHKVQHPEFEFYQGSIHANLGLTCADCHMPTVKDAQGKEYTQHWLASPLKHMEASCQSCHADLAEIRTRTEDIQGELRSSANEIGLELEKAINALRDARRTPNVDQELVRQAQAKHREAQLFLDWFLVENSTGFHNAAEGRRILKAARTATQEMANLTEQATP
ncbi:MAG: ammonia-forming cytochrome c nitrite reductase subunit c552 [Dethiobacter sp.]|nr:ammonia-forming cytochrome c nitrite reductase subunit c552 [Dethiobacter sp.]MBS3901525.1 ammonia-forming cytochrome c nitrite reductase subunit c552 [Dethiobacter sp.]MBS3989551.1 ammonia-forming cytochrome c nitrite reductase subunit c552 [Dethiobacter sp.]